MPLFDTHAHYNDDAFDQNRKGLLDALPDAGVGAVVIPGVDVESSRSALALAESRPWLFAAAGIHPEDCAGCTAADFSAIRDLCREKKVVAIGEIGLDYYWAENPPKEFQQMVFRRQLELALELELPVIVHDREAHGDSLEIVKEFPGVRGVFHCFSGSPEMAEELLKRGWYLGFDGPVTYKNARRAPEVVAVTPLDRIVVETDAPYMSPVPNRGRRNDSRNLPYIVEKLAEWKGISPEEMAALLTEAERRRWQKAYDAVQTAEREAQTRAEREEEERRAAGFRSLRQMFPEYERPEQLPDSVRREAREEDIPLLDSLLRHRPREERRAARELLRQRAAAAASAGSQAAKPESGCGEIAAMLRGVWN